LVVLLSLVVGVLLVVEGQVSAGVWQRLSAMDAAHRGWLDHAVSQRDDVTILVVRRR
jgi:hypothetical protein